MTSKVWGICVFTVLVGCSGGSDTDVAPPLPTSTSPTTTTPLFSSTEPAAPTTIARIADGPLAEVCPARVVIQTAELPSVSVGPLYSLLGAAPAVDTATQSVSAPLVRADGSIEDVTLELRSGGPATGFRSPIAVFAADPTIGLVHVSTAVAVRDWSTLPTKAVVSLTDRSADAVVYDPATYLNVTDWVTLRDASVEIHHLTDSPLFQFLESTGVVSAEQLVDGFDGGPAGFVASGGGIAQQANLAIEPVLIPSLAQWNRPVAALAAADEGWASLDDTLAVAIGESRLSEECIGRFVPIVQRAITSYLESPAPTNVLMSGIRAQFNPLDRLTPSLFDQGLAAASERGVFPATGTGTVGDIDMGQLTEFVTLIDPLIAVEDLASNRFVDPSVTR
ncbi:MAG: hypothetical protein ACJAXA_001855 [Candidatus Aldehydirespiratoraceae bacterium]|jgi:hypothetical protein